jgi:hypothetical protein
MKNFTSQITKYFGGIMSKKLLVLMCMLFGFAAMQAQELKLQPYAVSPRIAENTDDAEMTFLDHPYNGLTNVGIGTKMFLYTEFADSFLTDPTWTVVTKPEGSTADFSAEYDRGDSTYIGVFAPDLEGVYEVKVSEGSAEAMLTIVAGKYVGYDDAGLNCGSCHRTTVNEYEGTGHADILYRGLEGTLSDHYGESCISCHTTGYDTLAVNDGFDDFAFIFPDTLHVGMYDSMLTEYPDAMARANVQCESCHGPGSGHMATFGDPMYMETTLAIGNCAHCHDDDHYHTRPEEFARAGHSNVTSYPGGTRTSCRGCHNGRQFLQFVEGEEITVQEAENITCAVCHDPHKISIGDEGHMQVRVVDMITLSNGEEYAGAGNGALCANCHQSRRDADTYTEQAASHYGPHYAPQTDMIIGTNAVTFGKKLPTTPHFQTTTDLCADCHMLDTDRYAQEVGAHTFQVNFPDGSDFTQACESCHGDIGDDFNDKNYYHNGNADHDGDGEVEGLQEEVHGLMDQLAAILPAAEGNELFDPHDDPDETWTKTELKAAYNYKMVYYDHSYGVHNPAFTVALLKVSIQAMENGAVEGGIVAIDDVPNDQGKQVKVIWNKFADDGVSADPVEMYKIKRNDGDDDVWTDVGMTVADASPRYAYVVPTLHDSISAEANGMTYFKVFAITAAGNVMMTEEAAGYSLDNLRPLPPQAPSVSIVANDIVLNWDGTGDSDVKEFFVYRSNTENFVASEENLLAKVEDFSFTDSEMAAGDYYYKIRGVDFAGNLGELSDEVAAQITSIHDGLQPNTYGLAQNFPNPFNPSTTIDFSIKTAGHVELIVFNTLGQTVAKVVDNQMPAGVHSITFQANNLASGVYFYRITVSNSAGVAYQDLRKMMLMK